MNRIDEINIEGWWNISFLQSKDDLGCVICKVTEDLEFRPQEEGDRKYLFQIMSKKYISILKFRDAICITNKNIVKSWEVINYEEGNFYPELDIVTGEITLDNRFINLVSSKLISDGIEREAEFKNNPVNRGQEYRVSDVDKGHFCLIERLDMINEPLEYLIVLRKEKSKLKNKIHKKFSKLKNNNKFNLKIIFEDELLTHGVIIKNLLMYDTLYVKLPKQKIWTTHQEWESDYFNEQMNELIKVFRSFNAQSIKYTITKNTEKNNNLSGEIGCWGRGFKASGKEGEVHNTSLEYNITYDKPLNPNKINKNIYDALYLTKEMTWENAFPKRNLDFFYFWKHPEWIQQLSHKTMGECTEMDFSHDETINNNINKSVASTLDKLNISYDKTISTHLRYNIVFNIKYYN